MKRLLIVLLVLALICLQPSLAENGREELIETIYTVYGTATEENGNIGAFDHSPRVDLDIAIWYRTNYNRDLVPFEQLYEDLFTYEKLESLFAIEGTTGFLFAYFFNLEDGGRDRVFMGTMTREQFESIDKEMYDELYYFDYLTIKTANKYLFPQFIDLIQR